MAKSKQVDSSKQQMDKRKPVKKKKKYNLNTRLRAAIRQLWLRSPMRYDVIKAARVGKNQIKCAVCLGVFPTKEIQVDHIDPVGSIDDVSRFVDRMFHGEQRAVCKPCHKGITYKTYSDSILP